MESDASKLPGQQTGWSASNQSDPSGNAKYARLDEYKRMSANFDRNPTDPTAMLSHRWWKPREWRHAT